MKRSKKKTILLAGGGTGGHAAPLLAVFQKLSQNNRDFEISVVGVGTNEEKIFLEQIPRYYKIKSGKLRRNFTYRNIIEFLNFVIGIAQAFFLILWVKPRVIFSKGGYVSLPVAIAAKFFNIPFYMHESDIEMGLANRMNAKKAKKVFVSYPEDCYNNVSANKLVFTGPILRENFGIKKPSMQLFGFDNNDPVIFLTGGSQGSLKLSSTFLAIAQKLLADYNIIHQAGKHSFRECNEFNKSLGEKAQKKYYLTEFLKPEDKIDMMSEAINCADIVITRAGSTISELAVLGKSMIIVPWKHSAQDHQLKNAIFFQKKDGAEVIEEDLLSPKVLEQKIYSLFSNNRARLREISLNAKKIVPDNGLEKICEELIKEIK